MTTKTISISTPSGETVQIGGDSELVLIAGPCAIETYDHCMIMADLIGKVCKHYGVKWIFKACYDKDCRSSPNSFHGLGLEGVGMFMLCLPQSLDLDSHMTQLLGLGLEV